MRLLFGSNGRLGSAIMGAGKEVTRGLSHSDVDITDRDKVLEIVERERPEVIINCAALTGVDYCEEARDEAWNVNVRGTRNIAEGARRAHAYMVHFSSDYALAPVNEYGWTKLASESLVDGLVIRTNFYDQRSWIMRQLLAGRSVKLLTTEYFNPISSFGLIRVMDRLIERRYKGIVNVGTRDRISFCAFGHAVAKVFGIDPSLIEHIERLDRRVPRSADCYLDVSRLMELGIQVLDITEDLELYKKFVLLNEKTYDLKA